VGTGVEIFDLLTSPVQGALELQTFYDSFLPHNTFSRYPFFVYTWLVSSPLSPRAFPDVLQPATACLLVRHGMVCPAFKLYGSRPPFFRFQPHAYPD